MMFKVLAYVIIVPFVMWVIDSLNLNGIFKKDKVIQARFFYIAITFALSYLLVNFLFDFTTVTTIY